MDLKNIAFIHDKFPFGGGEKVTSDISRYLLEKGYTIYLFASEINNDFFCATDHEIEFIKLPNRPAKSHLNLETIIENIKKFNIEVLFLAGIDIDVTEIKKHSPCKVVYCNHSIPFWEAISLLEQKKRNAKQTLGRRIEWIIFHWIKFSIFKLHIFKTHKLHKRLYESVDAYTVLCHSYATLFKSKIKTINPSKLFALYNPTTTTSKKIELKKKKQIIYVGRLSYTDKRADRLLNIWQPLEKQFPDWELLIIGDGPEYNNLVDLSIKLNLQRIKFYGFQTEVEQYYQNASILCLTSTFEGWGLVLLEAQSYGVIPIAFNCSAGVEEIQKPLDSDCVLIKPYSIDEYQNKLAQLMSNESLRNSLQEKCILNAKKYSPDIVGKQWEVLIGKL